MLPMHYLPGRYRIPYPELYFRKGRPRFRGGGAEEPEVAHLDLGRAREIKTEDGEHDRTGTGVGTEGHGDENLQRVKNMNKRKEKPVLRD